MQTQSDIHARVEAQRERVETLAAEYETIRDELSELYGQRNALSDEANQATVQATTARYHSEEQRFNAIRQRAVQKRGEVERKIQPLQRDESAASKRLADAKEALRQLEGRLQRETERAEYESATPAQLEKRGNTILSAIRAIDTKLASLAADRAALLAKKKDAEGAGEAARIAEDELKEAQAALEQQRADAYIEGRDVDLSSATKRLAKAEKSLLTATEKASTAVAAIPRIDERVAAVDEEVESLEAERQAKVTAWWRNCRRQAELAHREKVAAFLDSLRELAGFDCMAGDDIGRQLVDMMRDAVFMPVSGKYIEKLDTTPWLGQSDSSYLSGTLARLQAEFQAALQWPAAEI